MSITAEDIQKIGFEHSMRGYNVEQVDEFLEHVAQEVDLMNRALAELKGRLEAAQEAPKAAPGEVEEAEARAKSAAADAEAATSKAADALVRAEEAEAKAAAAIKRAEAAEAQLEGLQGQLNEKNELDSAISQAFISAQRSADALKEEARAEGERIYRESEAKARAFIREALAKKASIYTEIDALQQSSNEFRQRYIEMVENFAMQAKDQFSNMEPPQIPDGIINEMLPDIESMPGLPADVQGKGTAEGEESEDVPRVVDMDIPQIEVPKSTQGN